VAKERLQLILAHERNGRSAKPDWLPQLKNELLVVISKYMDIDPNDIKVDVQHHGDMEVLELKIEMPETKR
jgi:cell division topological specificity factor